MINVFDEISFQYGRLLHIQSPSLIKRYNRALHSLIGHETALSEFHIDCTGFSPEVAKELDNFDYLNAHGVNKKFILLTIQQIEFDIAKTHFSSTMHLIKSFYRDNKKSLTTLTAGDVVYGELDNKQFKASTVEEMLKADTIQITIETSKGLIEKSIECTNHVETLFEGDNWEDNDLLNKIIDLSKTCGNVIKNKAVPTSLSYKREHYFTTLFGGLYIFKGDKKTTVIVKDPLLDLKHHGLKTGKFEIIYLYKKDEIYAFLEENNYLEKISFDKLKEKTAEFDLKLLHTVLDKYIEKHDVKSFSYLNKSAIKNFIADNYDDLSNDFFNIEEFVTCIHTDDKSCLSRNEFSQYCYQVRQDLRGADISLISHLLCNFKPYSYLTLFIYNRGLFEKLFNKWSTPKQEYVKTYLYDHSSILNDLRNRIDVE